MYEKMIKSLDASILPDAETLISQLRQKLPGVYTEKEVESYSHALDLVLKIGIKLDYTPMMLYLPARPQLAETLVSQFQQLNKVLATRNQNKEWFHDFFGLFVAMPAHMGLSWSEIEEKVLERNK
ncbi:hypothetical protein [Peribacillus glennii]|uniref:Uncharacterized protein n=1 Tax=Peribacillus glennii TaxID=2303991 RepID=A0A372L7U5_9BACI|nr:hypothetical protein [Peribacillus glennii]RFU61035.1 hypothetical protein D0466_19625 [Peribacillus glennii]